MLGQSAGVRFEIVQQIRIHRQIFGQRAPHGRRIIGVDARAAQIRQVILGEIGQLLSQPVNAVVSVVDALAKKLPRRKDTRR
jgi:hypothetical protein